MILFLVIYTRVYCLYYKFDFFYFQLCLYDSKSNYVVSCPTSLVRFCVISWRYHCSLLTLLTHWGQVTHISSWAIIGSDNGLSPDRPQAIIWTHAGIFLIGHLRTKFNEILIEINIFSFTKMHLKMLSGKWRPFCIGLKVLIMLSFLGTW